MCKAKQNLWYELRHPVQVLAGSQIPPSESILQPRRPQLQLAWETHPFLIVFMWLVQIEIKQNWSEAWYALLTLIYNIQNFKWQK